MENAAPWFSFYFYVSDNIFQIEVTPDQVNPSWNQSDYLLNADKTLGAFIAYAPEPTANPKATQTVEEYVNWLKATKIFIEDMTTGETHWVKMLSQPHRPIEMLGWTDTDVLIFGQCGVPGLCMIAAVDAKKLQYLLTLEIYDYLEYTP